VFIKQRKVRRSERFQSKWSGGARKRREQVASIWTTAAVQTILFFFMLGLAYRSHAMMRDQFPDLAWYLRFSVPFFIVVIAMIILRSVFRNVTWALEANRPRGNDSHRDQ